MQRNSWFGTAIFVFAVVFLLLGTFLIRWQDFQHKGDVDRVLQARSVLDLSLDIHYDKPPIYDEQYHMHNDNGTSSAQYRVQGYNGKVVTITLPPDNRTYTVTFFFQEVVQDGIWQLTNRPMAGNTAVHYTLHIFQVDGNRHGDRTVTFTDPHYWATTAGHQFHIVMQKNGPTPDLTKLQSTSAADPRFEQIVQAFRNFGTPLFRNKVAQAQALVRAAH